MRIRSPCRCLLCELEIHLKRELCEAGREEQYASITLSDPLLSGYPSPSALSAHLRSCRTEGNGTHPADAIFLEMLRLRHRNGRDTLLRDVLLLAFIPVLHSTARQLARQRSCRGRCALQGESPSRKRSVLFLCASATIDRGLWRGPKHSGRLRPCKRSR